MRFLLAFILLVHGLIHLMGFAKAFGLAEIPQLSQGISKPMGLFWLLTMILFMLSAVFFLLRKEWWFGPAIMAVIFSQLLIIGGWHDAKFGTIANVIILLTSLLAYGHFRFEKMAQSEALTLLETSASGYSQNINKKEIENLPLIVQKWITTSGALEKSKTTSVRLKQKGEMKTKPNGNWMSFSAEQYFNILDPSFVWITKVDALPFIYMDGRDKLQNGRGEMLIKLLSWFPVVEEGNNEKVNSGSMQRYLAEMCWFPSAATEKHFFWESTAQNSAKATMKVNDKTVSGIFTFSENGEFLSFETQRYFGADANAKLETWFIEAVDYKIFDGIKIPNKCKVSWKLEDGDFNWLNLEITDLEYNLKELW